MFRRRRRVAETEETAPQRPGHYVREEVAEPPPRRPLLWPWLLLLLLLVAGGLAAAYLLTRDDDGSETRVPNVVGEPLAAAIRELGQRGYPADVRERVSTTEIGRVVAQGPDAGTKLDRGEQVAILVARGRTTLQVPKVVGLPVAEAFERLQAKGLRGRAEPATTIAGTQPPGIVVRQSPASFERAPRGSIVVLGVSRGPSRVAVPSLEGLTQSEASAALARVGLRPNVVRVPASEPRDTVVAQQPAAGVRRPKGSIVRINVSKGQAPATTTSQSTRVTVPDVVGRDEATARTTLHAAGLTVRTSTQRAPDPSQDGVVITQRPLAGQSVLRGSRVTIFVGRLTP
jgi:eukaryotic-like serine/threonine-protein kinase